MKSGLAWAAVILWALLAGTAYAAPPALARSEPAAGAKGVPIDIGVLRFWFDQDMKQNSWTFARADNAEFPPLGDANSAQWRDPRCIELRIGRLKPGTTYTVQLNSTDKQNFRSQQGDEPLPPTLLSFVTGADSGTQQPVGKKDLENAVRVSSDVKDRGALPPSDAQPGKPEAAVIGSWRMSSQGSDLNFRFSADGRFSRTLRGDGQPETSGGSWRLSGAVMELRFDGDDELLKFTVKAPEANILELWENPQSWLRLVRTGASASAPPALQPQASSGTDSSGRPSCPQGWADFKHPLIGMQACVPKDYWVRLRGGMMLTVEKKDSPGTMAFLIPFRPKPGIGAADIAQHFAKFAAESEPRFKARIVGQPAPDSALSHFSSFVSEQEVQGRFRTIIAAGGTMAFVIGVCAPQGRLEGEMPTLKQIARGFGFVPPLGRWIDYQSPAGGFTMKLPQGWVVQSSDGRTHKDNIDWAAFDGKKPLSRTFQWCPRFCSPQLLQDPLHAMRGYQPAQFGSHEQVIATSLGQISQNVKLLKTTVNQPLTRLFRGMNQQVAQILSALNAAQMDIVVYDCLAQAQIEGKPVLVAFLTGIQTMAINAGINGRLMDLSVTLRGWCAEPSQFLADSPVLEKVCSSMQLTPAFIRNLVQGNERAVSVIRKTYDTMNKIDDQIRQSRWDTMDAIAEMNYDTLRETGGYVNEQTGRIEQIPPEKVVKNSRGEYVSREEVQRGVPPEQATVLREAYSNDYMRGVYGRIEF